ncbi:MAG TPA: hypothetical protein HPP81_03130 [Deltaproteobacteria bacterium]|jgi:Fe-S oxidoreductase|nr:hypothetical protein [Deltaproteobacteria bacterium]
MGNNAEAARELGQKAPDISQYISGIDLEKYLRPVQGRVTYHDPCHLLRTQGVKQGASKLT